MLATLLYHWPFLLSYNKEHTFVEYCMYASTNSTHEHKFQKLAYECTATEEVSGAIGTQYSEGQHVNTAALLETQPTITPNTQTLTYTIENAKLRANCT